jgi:hypothetical protein
MNTLTRLFRHAALGLAAGSAMASAWASPVVFTAAGQGEEGVVVSARAEFDVVQHYFNGNRATALQVTVLNTSDTTTRTEGALTGVYFAATGGRFAAADSSSAGFDGWAELVRQGNGNGNSPEKLSSDVDLGPAKKGTATEGTYLAGSESQERGESLRYVITTVETGEDGFSAKNLGDEDFGIIASGSGLRSTRLRNTAWVDGGATFWLRMADLSDTDLLMIEDVSFSFGADDEKQISAERQADGPNMNGTFVPSAVPEPAPLVLMVTALAAFALRGRKRRAHA